ncbi:hypothetical protein MTsPCn5_20030 [Croceitalea sp. MTPC5]|uniref:type II toxin-antitoxin system RelE family toxin n=1 Tax=Croceitalea sp. MTPC5 TaxID=3056565 RepID=UPI002B3FFA31|nr:hypothetical protein MTsPCn5_20030 [Croceitalea sp. MTPC5]
MKIHYLSSALKDIKKIKDKKTKDNIKRIFLQIKEVESLKELGNLKKMSGHPSAYRIKIGNYRLGFYYENDVVKIARIVKRNDIYKLFP